MCIYIVSNKQSSAHLRRHQRSRNLVKGRGLVETGVPDLVDALVDLAFARRIFPQTHFDPLLDAFLMRPFQLKPLEAHEVARPPVAFARQVIGPDLGTR